MDRSFVIPDVGDVVMIVHAESLSVLPGALAVVVDPAEEVELEQLLRARVAPHLLSRFLCVRWMRDDPRWRGQVDGFYALGRFTAASHAGAGPDRPDVATPAPG